ncbi:predicted protein [Uncinocarpus reesii 1704]|uniref:Clr5 domain-containing protein n=1 Tax=Uncinocarpus reesii (strain UAMH 1704) TaxID=336963 RepID=C4JXI8_UNCRE|nr:uncharacterized protein UREG_06361 [Uncinocarpus reesii 1704]EEP81496.1 predicted protein [Uncinocarpus reesii 1704]
MSQENGADTDWERYKAEITQLYLREGKKGKPLHVVKAHMERNNQYYAQFKKWNIKKRRTGDDWKFVFGRVQKRKLEGLESDVYMDGSLVPEKKLRKEIARHVPLSYAYTCGSEPQTPEGVLVCNPGANDFSLDHGCEVLNEISVGSPVVVYSGASQGLTSLPCFQFQNLFHSWFDSKMRRVWGSPTSFFGLDSTLLPDRDPVGFISPSTIDSGARPVKVFDFMPEQPILEARQLLLNCLKEHSNSELTADDADTIALSLESVMIEQANGDLTRDAFGRRSKILNGLESGNPPLQEYAIRSNRPDVVKFLLDARADPNCFSPRETPTPLQMACMLETSELVEMLISAGAKVNAVSQDGTDEAGNFGDNEVIFDFEFDRIMLSQTPLHIAADHENWEAVQVLLKEGADVDLTIPKSLLDSLLYKKGHFGNPPVFSPLQAAVRANNLTMVGLLLSVGAHIDARLLKDYGHTALQIAVLTENDGLVRVLLQNGADINASAGRLYGYTALQAAAEYHNNTELLTFLLQEKANVNAGNQEGHTALQVAAGRGNVEGVQILLAAGADVNAYPCPKDGKTALQAAITCGVQATALEIVKILLKKKADVNAAPSYGGFNALQLAARHGNLEIVELLLNAGAVPDSTALSQAVFSGSIATVTALLLKGADPNNLAAVNSCGTYRTQWTPLQEAARIGNIDLIRLLLTCEADVNAPASWEGGRTALQAAAEHGSLQVVEELIEAGANINASAASTDGVTALEAAVRKNDSKLTRFLLDHGATLAIADETPEMGILNIVTKTWSIDEYLAEMLIKAGADVNPSIGHGQKLEAEEVAVYDVASRGSFSLMQMLLMQGANVNIRLKSRWGPATALQAAVQRQHVDIIQALLDRSADVNEPANTNSGGTALQYAVLSGNIGIAQLLLKYGADVNAPGSPKNGRTALQAAAGKGHIGLVNLLLQHRANVNAPACEDGGVTALQGAATAGNIRIVLMLLAAGADVDGAPAMVNGRTAIEGAAEHGRLDALHILLNYHPDTEDLGLKKKRAARLAIQNGHFAIARLGDLTREILAFTQKSAVVLRVHVLEKQHIWISVSNGYAIALQEARYMPTWAIMRRLSQGRRADVLVSPNQMDCDSKIRSQPEGKRKLAAELELGRVHTRHGTLCFKTHAVVYIAVARWYNGVDGKPGFSNDSARGSIAVKQ